MDIDMKTKDHGEMVANITMVHALATGTEIASGLSWYRDAHDFAGHLRTMSGYRLETAQCAAIIAALSPLTPWDRNKSLAQEAVRRYVIGERLNSGTLAGAIAKVDRILDGEDPWAVLTSQKVRAFFECILYNGDTDTVCIDRHAMSVAYGFGVPAAEQSMTPRQYSAYAAAYIDAAAAIGIPAAKLQAITWVAWRRSRGIA